MDDEEDDGGADEVAEKVSVLAGVCFQLHCICYAIEFYKGCILGQG